LSYFILFSNFTNLTNDQTCEYDQEGVHYSILKVIPIDIKDGKIKLDHSILYTPYISTQVEVLNWKSIDPPSSFKNNESFAFLLLRHSIFL